MSEFGVPRKKPIEGGEFLIFLIRTRLVYTGCVCPSLSRVIDSVGNRTQLFLKIDGIFVYLLQQLILQ